MSLGHKSVMPAQTQTADRRTFLEWLLVAFVLSGLVLWLTLASGTRRADNLVYDGLLQLGGSTPSEQIVVVAIDNRSVEALGHWPWSREVHARLLDRLTAARAAAVGYDILFTEDAQPDDDFAKAIARNGRVHLPLMLEAPGYNGTPWRVVEPVPQLSQAAAAKGHVNLTPDMDGKVRRAPLYITAAETTWPHLALTLFQASGGHPAPHLSAKPEQGLVARDSTLIRFRTGSGGFRTVSFIDLLNGEVPSPFLENHLVLVGVTAEGLGDRYATPVSPRGALTPGVEILAALLDTLLQGDAPQEVPALWLALLSLAPLWVLFAGFLRLRPAANLILSIALILGVFIASGLAFLFGFWVPPLPVATGLVLAGPLWSWRRLTAASAYMQTEVDAFQTDVTLLPAKDRARVPRDHIGQQVFTLRFALRRLRDLNHFIADTLRSLPDATLAIDDEGLVTLVNSQANRLFGTTDLEGRDIDALFRSLGEERWRRLLGAEGADNEITTPSGTVLKVDSSPLSDPDGVTRGQIIRLADVTAIRTIERQREQALQLLSHDMRSPQVSILTLLDGGATRDTAFERRIAGYSRRTLSLADSYVQLARAESKTLETTLFDLTQILVESADGLWPQASAKGIAIEVADEASECWIEGDPTLVARALINLIDNAVKYSPDQSVVRCCIDQDGGAVRPTWTIRIHNDGPGLTGEQIANLFEPFHQNDPDADGVGLGLAFVRTVVERHGGAIRCESKAGEGVTFLISFRQATDAAVDF